MSCAMGLTVNNASDCRTNGLTVTLTLVCRLLSCSTIPSLNLMSSSTIEAMPPHVNSARVYVQLIGYVLVVYCMQLCIH